MKSHRMMAAARGVAGMLARKFPVVTLALMLAAAGVAKMYEAPRSFALQDQSQEQVQVKTMPKVDAERLKADDQARRNDVNRPGPMRFAVGVAADFTLENAGTWQTVPDGKIWRLRIQSAGATSHNLGFTRYEMPEGAKLWVYDPGHTHVEGPYTAKNRSKVGSLWTPIIEGDEIVVEVFVPTGVAQPGLLLSRVNQGYYGGAAQSGLFGQSEGTCEIDVICPQGNPWRNQIRAVAVFTINNSSGGGACTGTLMNDTALDFKPYFLTANHCFEDSGDPSSMVFYWNFESPTCGTHGPGSTADNQTGAALVANYAPSDFALVQLSASPDPTFNVWYAGWDASGVAPPSTVVIHHPVADVKAISFSNTAPQSADWTGVGFPGGVLDPAGNHWQVIFDVAGTEPGSSGACLFSTTTQRCIGQNHGGDAACATSNPTDFYGKFSVSWTGGGTAATRLKDWLDPISSGVLGLDGDPHITTANGVHYDFQGAGEYIAFRDPDGLEIQTRQTPIATTFFPGPLAYDGLATCVSLNTAVAARVGNHRVSYEPNLSGIPDPSGLQLRVDGALTTLGPTGIDFGDGSRIGGTATSGGLEVDFSDTTALYVTPTWWPSQSKWYLNVDINHAPVSDGGAGLSPANIQAATNARGPRRPAGPGGIAGAIAPGSWLPALPDGSSLGPLPAAIPQRYDQLYHTFGAAWRVTDSDSLFDYAPGTNTGTYTLADWPLQQGPCVVPNAKPVEPASEGEAERACKPVIADNARANCVFDVRVTGNPGFAKTYVEGQHILADSTRTTLAADEEPTQVGEWVTFVAFVTPASETNSGVPAGAIEFLVDGAKAGEPVKLDASGRARWETERLRVGTHKVTAHYLPHDDSKFLPSTSLVLVHIVERCPCVKREHNK